MSIEHASSLSINLIEGFESRKFCDPDYLNWCRFLAAQVIKINSDKNPGEVIRALKQNGVAGRGVLFDEEIMQIWEEDPPIPKPWSKDRTQVERHNKHDDGTDLFGSKIPGWVSSGLAVGMTYGKWDIFGPRYALYLKMCSLQCDKLVVGVVENGLFEKYGPNRPYNDFGVRLAQIAELPYVSSVHPIIKSPGWIDGKLQFLPYHYYPGLKRGQINIRASRNNQTGIYTYQPRLV